MSTYRVRWMGGYMILYYYARLYGYMYYYWIRVRTVAMQLSRCELIFAAQWELKDLDLTGERSCFTTLKLEAKNKRELFLSESALSYGIENLHVPGSEQGSYRKEN